MEPNLLSLLLGTMLLRPYVFIFLTAYGAEIRLPAAFADRPRLAKPCLSAALRTLLEYRSTDAGN